MDKSFAIVVMVVVGIAGLALGVVLGFFGSVGFLVGQGAAFGSDAMDYEEYFDVEVLDYEVRNKGVYIKLQNTGHGPVDDLYFEVEVRDDAGRLVEEYELNLMKAIGPGAVEETIMRPMTMDGDIPDMTGKDITVTYSYGWRTPEDD